MAPDSGPRTLADDRRSILRTLAPEEAVTPPELAEQRYRVGPELGAGGMGSVYRVEDHDLGREVALKALRPELAADPEFRARFLREARATGQLEHPNIVPLHDLGLSGDGTPYFTMKLVRGESLEQVIEKLRAGDADTHRHFSFHRRLAIVQEICSALEYAHSRGVLHRDLKPSNVMIGPYGEVMVLDWGIARHREVAEPTGGAVPSEAGVTQAGQFLGTLGYAAPEQLKGEPLDGRADVYALGALAYVLLALRSPFPEGEEPGQTVARILTEDPPTPDHFYHPAQGRVPREVANVVARALARDREARYPTPAALREDIQAYLDGQARVVCVSTGLKRSVFLLARLMDDYPVQMVFLVVFLLTLPLAQAYLIWMLL